MGSLKSKGFKLESTHITKPERLEKLMALLAIGFAWAHKVGEWRAQKHPITRNHYKNETRPQFSYFHYGVEFIRDIILHFSQKWQLFKSILRQLSPPQIGLQNQPPQELT